MFVRKSTAIISFAFLSLSIFFFPAAAQAAKSQKPNILVIMSDDVGITNISAYSRGLVGYQTPNIDRIANEGILFTDYYG
ncbi:MAG: sulfatase-like hydrolase/transferase, partial [Acidiferrobacterales bacterium]